MHLCCPRAQWKKAGKISPLVDAHQLADSPFERTRFEPPPFYNQLTGPEFIDTAVQHGYAVRRYADANWLSTIVAGGGDVTDAWTLARPRLSAYFSGANKSRVKIARTCPVLCTTKQRTLNEATTRVVNMNTAISCMKGDDMDKSQNGKDSRQSNETESTTLNGSITPTLPSSNPDDDHKKYVRFHNEISTKANTEVTKTGEPERPRNKLIGKGVLKHKTPTSELDRDTGDGHRVFKFSSFVSATDIAPLDRRLFFERSDERSFFVGSARKLSLKTTDRWTDLRGKLDARLRIGGERFDEDGYYLAFYDGRQSEVDKKYGEVWFAAPQPLRTNEKDETPQISSN